MSARKVLEDALRERGETPADEIEVLRHAVRLSPATGEAREGSDETTRALAQEVRESITTDEAMAVIFRNFGRRK